jgi:hypothetical protein
MSSNGSSALLSATFYEDGYEHLVELVHQRDADARRRLHSLDIALYDADGKPVASVPADPGQEVLDLGALVAAHAAGAGRLMVLFDARYDERIFPYRPHHYAYLHRRGSNQPSLYYAVNAVLGGVPDRIGATGMNNFETYLFLRHGTGERHHSVLLGNPSRFVPGEAQVTTYYRGARHSRDVTLAPKAHVEVTLDPERGGARLERVEVKALFRLASYVAGRTSSGELVLFDHLFTYFR